jgi:flagellar biogenesis protein FliO
MVKPWHFVTLLCLLAVIAFVAYLVRAFRQGLRE